MRIATVARQKVTGYVLDHVSDHMGDGEPSLVIDGERSGKPHLEPH